MLPGKGQKVDISSFSEQEKDLFQKYGKVPSHKGLLANKLKERKYFDSGDYAMSKAGHAPQHNVGTAIPSPADIPHASPPSNPSTSPSNVSVIGTSPTNLSNLSQSPNSKNNTSAAQQVQQQPPKEPISS